MKTTYHPTTILSSNTKTGCSLNLPIKGHCTPTKNCAATCYAKCGHTALPSNIHKQIWLSNYLRGKDISGLINECKAKQTVRLSGTGDLLPCHTANIIRLAKACPQTVFWGMTRKLDIAKKLNGKLPNLKLMVSVDASSPQKIWDYNGVLCYGPKLKDDKVPKDKRIITVFPYHSHGRVVKGVTKNPKDCKAVHHLISGCSVCGRCWDWEW